MKRIVILGATGSVGKKALAYVLKHNDQFLLTGISAHSHFNEIENTYSCLTFDTKHDTNFDSFLQKSKPDLLINAISGFDGLQYSIKTLKNGIPLGLANKESIVCGGELLIELSKDNKAGIIPLDSEHNSLFQLLNKQKISEIESITLTASGGPFRNYTNFEGITTSDALKHPTWEMGNKITIDSATMVNKVLELFEALFLFGIEKKRIHYCVEATSKVHALVTLCDGTIFSLLSPTDMIMPISYALHYPERALQSPVQPIDLSNLSVSFLPVNKKLFRIFILFDSLKNHYHYNAIVINAANEVAVEHFLHEQISFETIYSVIEYCVTNAKPCTIHTFDEIYEIDKETRQKAYEYIQNS